MSPSGRAVVNGVALRLRPSGSTFARINTVSSEFHLSIDITTYEVMCATPGSAVRRSAWKTS